MTDQTAATECAFADEGCTCGRPRLTLTEAQARMAATPKPGPTFATYLDRHDRDQLDARAACAEAERDEALDARDVVRQQLDAMKAAKKRVLGRLEMAEHVIDLIRDGQEQIDRALATWDTQPGVTPVEADDDTDPAAVQDMLDDATRAFADASTSSERVEVIRDLLAGWYAAWPATAVTDEHEGIAHQLVALINAAEARVGQPSPALGSVSPRAQGDTVATAEQALRDRAEHAIRDRLTQAWKAWPADEVFLDQVAAVAAVAAVNELGRAEREG